MDKKLIIEQINRNIETIVEQTQAISQYEKKIPQIEIDIVMGNLRDLYEGFVVLNSANNQKTEIKQEKQVMVEKTFHEEVFATDIEKPAPMADEKPVIKEIIPEEKEPVKETIPQPVIAEKKEVPQPEVRPEQTLKKSSKSTIDLFSGASPIMADKFKDEKKSINEKLAGGNKEDNSLASKLKQNQITDLKSAIGINEKFQFINELFDGSMQEYTNAITKLNGMGSYNEALLFLNILAEQYKWKISSVPCKKLDELVQRRFV